MSDYYTKKEALAEASLTNPKPADPDAGARAAYWAHGRLAHGYHGAWEDRSDATKDVWRAVAEAVRKADRGQGR